MAKKYYVSCVTCYQTFRSTWKVIKADGDKVLETTPIERAAREKVKELNESKSN